MKTLAIFGDSYESKLNVDELIKPTVDIGYYYQSIWTIEKMNKLRKA